MKIGDFYKIIGEGNTIFKLVKIEGEVGYFENPTFDFGWLELKNAIRLKKKEVEKEVEKLKMILDFYEKSI